MRRLHNTSVMLMALFTFLSVSGATSQTAPSSPIGFTSKIAPVLRARCVSCHQGKSASAGLSLTSRSAMISGGAHGSVLTPNDPGKSLIFARISAHTMPPAGSQPLTSSEIDAIKTWILQGSKWDGAADLTPVSSEPNAKRAGLDWWSLLPLTSPHVPAVKSTSAAHNPIDNFILAGLASKSLLSAAPASKAVLIRRVTLDLIGMPPTPEEVSAFVADTSPSAYAKVVDRLLADSRYGECWGRHWLDVSRFGESNGFERDALRPNAWQYRDYVINSLNADLPYDRFVTEQIAGDSLPNATPQMVAATGFLVGGSWDEVGFSQANATARLRVREEELEEMIGTVSQTFLGLTVNCARCHDHKFDPIPQSDYYRMKSDLAGVHPGDRKTVTAELSRKVNETAATVRQIQTEIDRLRDAARRRVAGSGRITDVGGPAPLAQWTFESNADDVRGNLNGTLLNGAHIEHGKLILDHDGASFRSALLTTDVKAKTLEAWVSLPDKKQRGGGVISIQLPDGSQFDSVVYGELVAGNWMAGSESFHRSLSPTNSAEDSAVGVPIHVAIVYAADDSITIYRNGVRYAPSYTPKGSDAGLRTFRAGAAEVLIGLRHLGSVNGHLKGEVEEARLYDRALSAAEIGANFKNGPDKITEEAIRVAMTVGEKTRMNELNKMLLAQNKNLLTGSQPSLCYAAVPSQPEPTTVLERGDVLNPGIVVNPGGLTCITTPTSNWKLAATSPEAERRIGLANWIADPKNPLTSRVIVNRVWHYHFGRGIVASPNDFGFNGERPTNPALLDWLATSFLQHGESLKYLHRLICLSNTYRQSSQYSPGAAAKDADDSLLWRFPLRRMDGEVVRDSMLAISGQLNSAMGGPSFRPFTEIVDNAHIYSLVDTGAADQNRRTVYRMNVQSAKSPMLETLDCPDPSTKAPRRNATTTPLQALELMNNSFVLRQGKFFADRVQKEAGASTEAQVKRAYLLALGRTPSAVESLRMASLIKSAGLETMCWSIFNMSEFVYIQ